MSNAPLSNIYHHIISFKRVNVNKSQIDQVNNNCNNLLDAAVRDDNYMSFSGCL